MKKLIIKFVNATLPWAIVLGLGYGCEKILSGPKPLGNANSCRIVSEFPNKPYLHHQTFEGLYLTIEERQGDMRQVTFFDYGFDGKLDMVKILQKNRKDYVTTNSLELAKWQPIFEQMRERRFGKYKTSNDFGLK